jgi:hypothetical protein
MTAVSQVMGRLQTNPRALAERCPAGVLKSTALLKAACDAAGARAREGFPAGCEPAGQARRGAAR